MSNSLKKKLLSTVVLAVTAFLAHLPATTDAFAQTGSQEEPASRGKLVMGLDDCIRVALKSAPELGEAQADIEQMESRLSEAGSYRFPTMELTAIAGPAPEARKNDLFATDWSFQFKKTTWFTRTDAMVIQPLYTFGKISENMKAASSGIEVQKAGKTLKANEVALKVREYYYGLLLAREMKELVLEVQESLNKASNMARKFLEQGSDSVEETDIFKLDAFSGEAAKFLEEAKKGEALALAALKTRMGMPNDTPLEIASERMTMDEQVLPEMNVLVDRARSRRPEFIQLAEGTKARTALIEAARAGYYPDIFLAGFVSWAYADKRDRIHNPYISDQFQHTYGGVALGLKWKLDFGITGAKVANERAQYNRLLSTKNYADTFIPLQIRKSYLELKEAEKSAEASKTAYTNAKKWAVAALANFDFGVGPAKDIFEALQAYSRMRASYFQSIYNQKIASANLQYATGEQPLASGN